jgi:hypothetical protein
MKISQTVCAKPIVKKTVSLSFHSDCIVSNKYYISLPPKLIHMFQLKIEMLFLQLQLRASGQHARRPQSAKSREVHHQRAYLRNVSR